jgi:hypothetical protein
MSSRFKALFEEAKQIEPQPNTKSKKNTVQKKEAPVPVAPLEENLKPKSKKMKGKRSNPDYTGAFAYIPIALHDDVKIKLLRNKELDFSGLVENLLKQWLNDQN